MRTRVFANSEDVAVAGVVFTELFGGRVFEVDDLEPSTLSPVGQGRLAGPIGPAVDAAGRIAVAELNRHSVAVAEPGGAWQRFGSRGSGEGEFERPAAAAFVGGSIVVLDTGNGRIVSFDDLSGGGWTSFGRRGLPTSADPAVGSFADPRGLAVDAASRLWISDPAARRVVRIDALDGSGWTQIALPPSPRPPLPYGLASTGDGVVVLDVGNRRLLAVDAWGAATALGLAADVWMSPVFVTAVDSRRLVVADVAANELRLVDVGKAGTPEIVARLHGSPPDLVQPLFDSVGGVTA